MREEFEYYNFFKTPNILIEDAKEGIKGNRGKSLAINFIFWLSKLSFFAGLILLILAVANINNINFNLITFLILGFIFLLLSTLTYGPLKVSQCKHSINMVENTNPKFKDLAFGFKNKYFRNVFYGISLVFVYLFNLILLILPFVNKFINYQISGYILAENNDISVGEALRISTKLSKGHSIRFLKVFVKFIPEMLLCIPTILVYSLWLRPKYNATIYCYYKDIKE